MGNGEHLAIIQSAIFLSPYELTKIPNAGSPTINIIHSFGSRIHDVL